MDRLWKEKLKEVTKLSKIYGYGDYDEEFWSAQPAGVINMILMIYKDFVTFATAAIGKLNDMSN